MQIPEEAAFTDLPTLQRFAEATRYVESLHSPQKFANKSNPRNTTLSERGWLLNSVSNGNQASVILTDYNPSWSVYKIDQFGLWTTTPSFTLRVNTTSRTFTNPSCQSLQDSFAQFNLRAWCGNPVSSSSAGYITTAGRVDHHFWILGVPSKVTFAVTPHDTSLADGKSLIGYNVSELPVSYDTCFDALELEWPLAPGSRVILNRFNRGLGIVAAKPALIFT